MEYSRMFCRNASNFLRNVSQGCANNAQAFATIFQHKT